MLITSVFAALTLGAISLAAPTADLNFTRDVKPINTHKHKAPAEQSNAVAQPVIESRDDQRVLSIINKFDQAYGIPLKAWSIKLVQNTYATCKWNDGKTENHRLLDGTRAQVLIPGRYDFSPSTGSYTPFELMYRAWLCEIPSDSQLGDQCPQVLELAHMNDAGQRDHHDILTDPQFTQIGCAFFQNPDQHDDSSPFQGIWGCDLA